MRQELLRNMAGERKRVKEGHESESTCTRTWVAEYCGRWRTLWNNWKSTWLEALQMSIAGMEGVGIEYSAHVRDIGWQGTVRDGETAGTTGRNLQIEALKIKLTGSNATKYNIYYRGHASNIGWLDWAKTDRQREHRDMLIS